MKLQQLLNMMNNVKRDIDLFDVKEFMKKYKNHNFEPGRVQKLIDDIYQLEEDFILLDCEKNTQDNSTSINNNIDI